MILNVGAYIFITLHRCKFLVQNCFSFQLPPYRVMPMYYLYDNSIVRPFCYNVTFSSIHCVRVIYTYLCAPDLQRREECDWTSIVMAFLEPITVLQQTQFPLLSPLPLLFLGC